MAVPVITPGLPGRVKVTMSFSELLGSLSSLATK